MAYPLSVLPKPVLVPPARVVLARAVISSPLANESDSYLGGFARGRRFTYVDAAHFVWWTPDSLPAITGYGDGAYGSGAYGGMSGFGSDPFGRGPYGGG